MLDTPPGAESGIVGSAAVLERVSTMVTHSGIVGIAQCRGGISDAAVYRCVRESPALGAVGVGAWHGQSSRSCGALVSNNISSPGVQCLQGR